jgi:hypothetical protein
MENEGPGSYFYHEFMRRSIEKRRPIYRYLEVHSEARIDDVVSALSTVENMNSRDNRGNTILLLKLADGEDVVIWQRNRTPNYFAIVGADSEAQGDLILRTLLDALPPVVVKEPNVVPIRFWAKSFEGASYRIRHLPAPDWDTVSRNYPNITRNELQQLIRLRPSGHGGRIILWHGDPGTGKSYAIRALAYEWRNWCDFSFILDPENLFGDAGYMMSVIFDPTYSPPISEISAGQDDAAQEVSAMERWHLLIMEDADEFLTIDAKQRQGQSMARLLNMADGLIGQGVNLLILVTTNEPIGRIHPALARPGRCLANLEFTPLTIDEATTWLRVHGCDESSARANITLAELYAMKRGENSSPPERRPVGFPGV